MLTVLSHSAYYLAKGELPSDKFRDHTVNADYYTSVSLNFLSILFYFKGYNPKSPNLISGLFIASSGIYLANMIINTYKMEQRCSQEKSERNQKYRKRLAKLNSQKTTS